MTPTLRARNPHPIHARHSLKRKTRPRFKCLLEIAKEPAEADTIGNPLLQLLIEETIPLLKEEKLHHHHLVIVGAASLEALIVV